jgi:uncharacterized protein
MWSRRRIAALVLAAALFLLLIGGRVAAEFVVELLWYRSIGHERVFWTARLAGLAVRAGVAIPIGLFVFVNLWVVSRTLGAIRVRRRYGNIEIAERLPQGYIYAVVGVLAVFSAWWLSSTMGDAVAVLAALSPTTWGLTDPIHGRDAAFYVFQYPIISRVQSLAGLTVFWTALLAAASYVATSAIRVVDGRPIVSPAARRHLGVLVALFLVVLAWSFWLDRYAIIIAGQGVAQALGYTDASARLPGKLIATLLTLLTAAAIAYGTWVGRARLALASFAFLIVGLVATHQVYPSLIQRLVVEPNEFPRESAFIEHHLRFTRHAFGLAELRREPLPWEPPGALDVESARRRLAGVPLWDERPLLEAFIQRQSLFQYYDFASAHTDRYGPPGAAEQVAIAVRELEPRRLPEQTQTWQNLHFRYVASEGVVVSPTARMTEDAAPLFYVADLNPTRLSPQAPSDLALTESSIYFSERTRGYIILRDPGGPHGVPLDSWWRRLVFAWAFQSRNLLLSGEITQESRIVYGRHVADRARAVAPFLHFTQDRPALPVVHEGRVVWIVEGYTLSPTFPLSLARPFDGRNARYVRNSAKVVVDGVSGDVTVFAAEPDDPILRTYGEIFTGLVRPLEEMPPTLRRHLRVPPPIMQLQTGLLGEYHLRDARDFYEKNDAWNVATEQYRAEAVPVRPTYAMLPLPGEEVPEFLLMTPFVARGRQNMTALLVARNDPPHYGERILYELRRDEQIPGPQQIEAMIDQDPIISQQLALWRQGGTDVVRGHLIVVPFQGTLLYVEPLFLVAQAQAIPQLERVILANSRRVVMRPTLDEAIAALAGTETAAPARTPAAALATRPEAAPAAPGEPRPEPTPPAPADAESVARARRLMQQAEEQLRAGDWAGFGRTWEQLRQALGSPGTRAPGTP